MEATKHKRRAVSCLSFAPSRTSLNLDKVVCASASADGSVRLWDISTHHNSNSNKNSNTNSIDDQEGDDEDNMAKTMTPMSKAKATTKAT